MDKREDNEDNLPESNEEVKPMNFPNENVPKHDNYFFSPEKFRTLKLNLLFLNYHSGRNGMYEKD